MYFRRIGSSLIFFRRGMGGGGGEGGTYQIENTCFRAFLEKGHPSLVFRPGKKYHVFGKKIPPFQIVQERSCPGTILIEKTIFSEHLEKISYFCVFF